MREHLNDYETEQVAGGTVVISRDKMKVCFTSTRTFYDLVNCEYKDARNLADDLWEANQTLGDAQFDALVLSEYQARGWVQ